MPAQIQLCAGFIKLLETGKLKSLEEIRDFLPRAAGLRRPGDQSPVIDLLTLVMDTTLLHEMTHAIHPSKAGVDLYSPDSYLWKNIVRMSHSGGYLNSESLAYFAIIASLITPPSIENTPMRVNREGIVQVFPSYVNAKHVNAKRDIEHSEIDNVSSRQRPQSFNESHGEIYN